MTLGGQFLRNERGFYAQVLAGAQLRNAVWRAGRTRHMNGQLSQAIVPVCTPWPFSSDANGVAYPAGTVGVRYRYSPFDPTPDATNNALLVAVPSALPAGYTFRPSRDHLSTPTVHPWNDNCQQWGFDSSLFTPGTIGSNRVDFSGKPTWFLRTTSGLSPYNWFPENLGQSAYGPITAPSTIGNLNAASGTPVGWFSEPIGGIRYLQLQYDRSVVGGPSDTLLFELVVNADGSQTQPGDTVVWSATVNGGTGTYDSGLVMLNWNAPSHSKVWMGWRLYWSVVTRYVFSTQVHLMMGARLDIPFPWTCYGLDGSGNHIVAPGGT